MIIDFWDEVGYLSRDKLNQRAIELLHELGYIAMTPFREVEKYTLSNKQNIFIQIAINYFEDFYGRLQRDCDANEPKGIFQSLVAGYTAKFQRERYHGFLGSSPAEASGFFRGVFALWFLYNEENRRINDDEKTQVLKSLKKILDFFGDDFETARNHFAEFMLRLALRFQAAINQLTNDNDSAINGVINLSNFITTFTLNRLSFSSALSHRAMPDRKEKVAYLLELLLRVEDTDIESQTMLQKWKNPGLCLEENEKSSSSSNSSSSSLKTMFWEAVSYLSDSVGLPSSSSSTQTQALPRETPWKIEELLYHSPLLSLEHDDYNNTLIIRHYHSVITSAFNQHPYPSQYCNQLERRIALFYSTRVTPEKCHLRNEWRLFNVFDTALNRDAHATVVQLQYHRISMFPAFSLTKGYQLSPKQKLFILNGLNIFEKFYSRMLNLCEDNSAEGWVAFFQSMFKNRMRRNRFDKFLANSPAETISTVRGLISVWFLFCEQTNQETEQNRREKREYLEKITGFLGDYNQANEIFKLFLIRISIRFQLSIQSLCNNELGIINFADFIVAITLNKISASYTLRNENLNTRDEKIEFLIRLLFRYEPTMANDKFAIYGWDKRELSTEHSNTLEPEERVKYDQWKVINLLFKSPICSIGDPPHAPNETNLPKVYIYNGEGKKNGFFYPHQFCTKRETENMLFYTSLTLNKE